LLWRGCCVVGKAPGLGTANVIEERLQRKEWPTPKAKKCTTSAWVKGKPRGRVMGPLRGGGEHRRSSAHVVPGFQ